ncbi:MAG: glycosyltransferase [Opitutales bacterium]
MEKPDKLPISFSGQDISGKITALNFKGIKGNLLFGSPCLVKTYIDGKEINESEIKVNKGQNSFFIPIPNFLYDNKKKRISFEFVGRDQILGRSSFVYPLYLKCLNERHLGKAIQYVEEIFQERDVRTKVKGLLKDLSFEQLQALNSIFDPDFYFQQKPEAEKFKIRPLFHYLAFSLETCSPSALFDLEVASRIDVLKTPTPYPVINYVKLEDRREINPTRYFPVPNLGRRESFSSVRGAFVEYASGGWKDWNLVPWLNYFIDQDKSENPVFKVSRYSEFKEKIRNPIIDYFFDLNSKETKLINAHQIFVGCNRIWRRNFSYFNIPSGQLNNGEYQLPAETLRIAKNISLDFDHNWIVFFSHNLSRTGAPLILLNLARHFFRKEFRILMFYDDGGPLKTNFERYASVVDLKKLEGTRSVRTTISLLYFKKLLGLEKAICNTANSLEFLERCKDVGLRTTALIHEHAAPYSLSSLVRLAAASENVVFPSRFVQQSYVGKNSEFSKASISRQGLFDWIDNERISHSALLEFRKKYLPGGNGKLILGCGYIDLRKGVDHFVQVAIQFLRAYPTSTKFIWIGDVLSLKGEDLFFWLKESIASEGLDDKILFVGEVEDPSLFIKAADLLFLTSRVDPYPCVAIEAIAMGVPVLAFAGCTGSEEVFKPPKFEVVDINSREIAVQRIAEISDVKLNRCNRTESLLDFSRYSNEILDIISEKSENSAQTRPVLLFPFADWSISGVNFVNFNLIKELSKNDKDFDLHVVWTKGVKCFNFGNLIKKENLLDSDSSEYAKRKKMIGLVNSLPDGSVLLLGYDKLSWSILPFIRNNIKVCGVLHSDHYEYYFLVQVMWPYIDGFVAVSNKIMENSRTLNPTIANRIEVIYSGVPQKSFKEYKPHERLDIVFCGRIEVEQKRADLLVPLIKSLAAEGLNFHFHIIGLGSFYFKLREILTSEVGMDLVSFYGWLSEKEVDKIIEHSSLICNLSEYEGLPITILKALSYGTIPILPPHEDNYREILIDGHNAIFAERYEIKFFVKKILWLASEPELRETLACNCYNTIRQKDLTNVGMAKNYLSFFRRLKAFSKGQNVFGDKTINLLNLSN